MLTYVSSTYASFLSLPAPLNGFYCHDGNPISECVIPSYIVFVVVLNPVNLEILELK